MDYTLIASNISAQWTKRGIKTDWTGLESILVEILKSNQPADAQLMLIREAIDAFTRRGHFVGSY